MKNKTTDNPNPAANIGFICHSISEYLNYKHIYSYLPNSEFIVNNTELEHQKGKLNTVSKFLSKKKVYWKYIDSQDDEVAADDYKKYGLLIAIDYNSTLKKEYNKDKKKVRLLVKKGNHLHNFGPLNAFFDIVLLYKNKTEKDLKIYGNTKKIHDEVVSNRGAMKSAKIINKLLYNKKPMKNFFSRSIIAYTETINNNFRDNKNILPILSFYSKIRSMPILKRIMFIKQDFF